MESNLALGFICFIWLHFFFHSFLWYPCILIHNMRSCIWHHKSFVKARSLIPSPRTMMLFFFSLAFFRCLCYSQGKATVERPLLSQPIRHGVFCDSNSTCHLTSRAGPSPPLIPRTCSFFASHHTNYFTSRRNRTWPRSPLCYLVYLHHHAGHSFFLQQNEQQKAK